MTKDQRTKVAQIIGIVREIDALEQELYSLIAPDPATGPVPVYETRVTATVDQLNRQIEDQATTTAQIAAANETEDLIEVTATPKKRGRPRKQPELDVTDTLEEPSEEIGRLMGCRECGERFDFDGENPADAQCPHCDGWKTWPIPKEDE